MLPSLPYTLQFWNLLICWVKPEFCYSNYMFYLCIFAFALYLTNTIKLDKKMQRKTRDGKNKQKFPDPAHLFSLLSFVIFSFSFENFLFSLMPIWNVVFGGITYQFREKIYFFYSFSVCILG